MYTVIHLVVYIANIYTGNTRNTKGNIYIYIGKQWGYKEYSGNTYTHIYIHNVYIWNIMHARGIHTHTHTYIYIYIYI